MRAGRERLRPNAPKMTATKLTAFAATAAVAVCALAPAIGMAKASGPGRYTVNKQSYVFKQPTKIVDGTVFKAGSTPAS